MSSKEKIEYWKRTSESDSTSTIEILQRVFLLFYINQAHSKTSYHAKIKNIKGGCEPHT